MDAPEMYPPGARALQEHFDSTRLADRLSERLSSEALLPAHIERIRRADCCYLATVDLDGFPDVSYKGGAPGFIEVIDEHTLALPSYDGNGMYRSMGNIVDTGKVSLLFIEHAPPGRLRIHGTAVVHQESEWVSRVPGAELVVEIRIGRAFPNCPRYIHDPATGTLSPNAPRAGHEVPEPEWKRRPEWAEVLPTRSPGL